jgi:hypothetical protein
MIYLRQSTASQEVPLGYFVDSANGNDEETGLTIANTDIKVWKAGATTLANKNSGGATHISNGIYYAVLDATDTDTIGSLVIFVHVAGALPMRVACVVLDEAVYDVMFGTTAPATVSNITGGTITTATNVTTVNGLAAGVITASSIAADAITAAKVAADVSAEIADAVWDEATTGHTSSGTFGEQLKTDVDAILEDTGTTLQGELDGIQADTEDLQSRLPAALVSGRIDASVGAMAANTLTASALNADAVTEIQSGLSTLDAAAVNAEVVDVLTVDVIADSTPADGSRPTMAEALLMLTRLQMEKSVAGTTVEINKEDGTTAAFTLELDDATNPTSITRAS